MPFGKIQIITKEGLGTYPLLNDRFGSKPVIGIAGEQACFIVEARRALRLFVVRVTGMAVKKYLTSLD